MNHTCLSRIFRAALAAALILSLSACKANQPGQSSSASSSPAQSAFASQQVETPLEDILNILAKQGLEEYDQVADDLTLEDLLVHTADDRTLVVLRQTGLPHAGGLSNLMAGVWDETTDSIVGDVLLLRGDDDRCASWQDEDDLLHVLLVNSSTAQGYEGGSSVRYLTFDGQTLTQVTQVPEGTVFEGALPDGWQESLLSMSEEFWADLKAVPYPGGMELFSRNPDFDALQPSDSEQWMALGYVALDGVELPNK